MYTPSVVRASDTASVPMPRPSREGRRSDEFRAMSMSVGVVKHAAGSAYVELGATKVLASLFGPRTVGPGADYSDEGILSCDFKFAPFAQEQRRETRGQGQDEQDLSARLREALAASVQLDKLPKLQLDLFVLVVQADGGQLSAAIAAGSLALADAGVACYDLVASCGVAVAGGDSGREGGEATVGAASALKKKNDKRNSRGGQQAAGTAAGTAAAGGATALLDPTASEAAQRPGLTVAMMPALQQVTSFVQQGSAATAASSFEAMDLCTKGCGSVHAVMQRCLVDSAQAKHSMAGAGSIAAGTVSSVH